MARVEKPRSTEPISIASTAARVLTEMVMVSTRPTSGRLTKLHLSPSLRTEQTTGLSEDAVGKRMRS